MKLTWFPKKQLTVIQKKHKHSYYRYCFVFKTIQKRLHRLIESRTRNFRLSDPIRTAATHQLLQSNITGIRSPDDILKWRYCVTQCTATHACLSQIDYTEKDGALEISSVDVESKFLRGMRHHEKNVSAKLQRFWSTHFREYQSSYMQ